MTNEIVHVWGFRIDAWEIAKRHLDEDEYDRPTSIENYLCSHPKTRCFWKGEPSSWYLITVNNRYESVDLDDFDYFLAKKHIRIGDWDQPTPEEMREFWAEEPESVIEEGNLLRESLDIPISEKLDYVTCDSDFDRTPNIFYLKE